MGKDSLDNEEMLESNDNFETVYESYAKSIYRFLYWRTKNIHLSEDLTSSVFEKAWRSRSNFRGGSEQAWLYRIARNVLIDHWRKNKELFIDNTSRLEDESKPSAAELIDKDMQLQLLKKALSKLPRDMRMVINLRFIEGLSSKQVAKKLDISDSNVRVIQYRALKKLKDYLQ